MAKKRSRQFTRARPARVRNRSRAGAPMRHASRALSLEPLEERRLLAVQPFLTPLESLGVAGSLVYGREAQATIDSAGEVEVFTVSLDDGQTVTLHAQGETIQPSIALYGPTGVMRAAQAPAVGEAALVNAVATQGAGLYVVAVSGAGATTGAFTTTLLLNSLVEEEQVRAESANDSAASAEALDQGFVSLGPSGAERAAVLGALVTSAQEDYYRFTLGAGESATVILQGAGAAQGALELLAPDGESVLATGAQGEGDTHAIHSFANAAGERELVVRVSGFADEYQLVVTRGADFDAQGNDGFDAAQDISAIGAALGHVSEPRDEDWYRFGVGAGDPLRVAAAMFAEGPFEFLNGLTAGRRGSAVRMQLYSPDGVLQASVSDLLNHTAQQSGEYRLRVSASGASGEYVVSVDGATGANRPPSVVDLTPTLGSVVAGFPTTLTVEFSEPILATSVHPADLSFGGRPALAARVIDAATVEFDTDPLADRGSGAYLAIMGPGAVADLQGRGVTPFLGTINVDATGPQVLGTLWNGGLLSDPIPSGPLVFEAVFGEDLFQAGPGGRAPLAPTSDNVRLVELTSGAVLTPLAVAYDPTTHRVRVEFDALPEGDYELTLFASDGAIEDSLGNDLDGEPLGPGLDGAPTGDGAPSGDYTVTFSVDSAAPVEANPLARLAPVGSLALASMGNQGILNGAGDADDFLIPRIAGAPVAAVLTPAESGVTLTLELIGGAIVTAAAPGAPMALAPALLAGAGPLLARVTGDGSTAYTLDVLYNATTEQLLGDTSEASGLAINDSALAVGSTRYLALGHSDAIAIGAGRLFAAPDDGTLSIVELDPANGAEINRFAAPAALSDADNGLAFDGQTLWFLSGEGFPYLYGLDADTGQITRTVEALGLRGRSYDALAALGGFVYASDVLRGDIVSVHPASGTLRFIDFDAVNPGLRLRGGLAAVTGPDALVATLEDGRIAQIDPQSGVVLSTFQPSAGSTDGGVAIVGDDIYVGAAEGDGRIAVYDRQGALVREIDLPYGVSALGGDQPGATRGLSVEPNDTIAGAVVGPTGAGVFADSGEIGDNPNLAGSPALDVDLVRVTATAGQTIIADIDASAIGSPLDPILTLFDAQGQIVTQNDDSGSLDSFIEFTVPVGGDYYIGVSSFPNFVYDPNVEGSGFGGGSTGPYNLLVEVQGGIGGLAALEAENAIPDVDRYSFELTSAAGAALDIVLAGQSGADFATSTLRVLGPDGVTELAASSSAPLGPDVTNYDAGILGLQVAEPGVYTVLVDARTPGDYALLVTQDTLFESEPNDDDTLPLRGLAQGGAAMGALGSFPTPGGGSFLDPSGDTFGFGAVQPDLAGVSASVSPTELILEATFHNDISPASAGLPNSVIGFWDLDLDQDPDTGAPSAQSVFAPPTQQGGPLGVEAFVVLGDVAGQVTVVDALSGAPLGMASISFADRAFTISVPLDVLSDDGRVNYGVVIGSNQEPTDAAPDGEAGTSLSIAPSAGVARVWGAALAPREVKPKPGAVTHSAAATALLPVGVSRDLIASHMRSLPAWPGAQPAAAQGAGQLIVATESEPNNSPLTADPVALGFQGGEDPEVNLSGTLTLSVPTTPFTSREDDGSIPRANETGLVTGGRVVTDGFIGNGPFANTGGDYDWYRVANVTAGQLITADVDAEQVGSNLDPSLGVYNSAGVLIAANDDFDGLDSFLQFAAPEDGDYYVAVRGFGGLFQGDPFDSGSGSGPASTGPYSIFLSLDAGDVDYYSVSLEPGDVLSASVGGAGRVQLLRGEQSGVVPTVGSGQNLSFAHPVSSPLRTSGDAALSWVVDTPGTYFVAVSGGEGAYGLQLRLFRPAMEERPEDARQSLFLDFDGETFDRSIFGLTGGATLSPLTNFLDGWGLTPDDEDAVIDAILASVEESLSADIRQSGANGDFDSSGVAGQFDIEILNSRDHVDPFGYGDASRIIVGGTIGELGIPTIGLAETIDVGNFDSSETAVVLLDLLSASPLDPNSLNQYQLDPSVSIIDLIGVAVGNIIVHEAGHFFGAWHTDQFNGAPSIMDQGGFLANTVGVVGPVWGDGDDVDVDLGPDSYVFNEGFNGVQNSLTALAWGLSTGTADASLVGPTVAFVDPPLGPTEDLEVGAIRIGFSEPVNAASALDPGDYRLIEAGANGVFESGSGDDVVIPSTPALGDDGVVTLTLNTLGRPLGLGDYRLTIDSSIVDSSGNALNSLTGPGGGSATVHEFSVIFNFPAGGDLFAIDLAAGEHVSLFTRTPLGGGAEPLSDLDAEILVYGPGGTPFTSDAGGLDGRNPLVELAAQDAGTYVVQVRAESGAGEYVLHAAPPTLFGDFNRDSVVDSRDFLLWRGTLGRSVAPGEGADADYDGHVGASDYQVWRAHVGDSALPPRRLMADSDAGVEEQYVRDAGPALVRTRVLLPPDRVAPGALSATAPRAEEPAALPASRDNTPFLLLASRRLVAVDQSFAAPDDWVEDGLGEDEPDEASLGLALAEFGLL